MPNDRGPAEGRTAETVAALPRGEHFLLLQDRAISVPGDERSRLAPGHGYPAHTEHVLEARVYLDKGKFEADLAQAVERQGAAKVLGLHVTETYTGRIVATVQVEPWGAKP